MSAPPRFDSWVANSAMTRFMREIVVANDSLKLPAWLRELLDHGVVSRDGYLLLADASAADRVSAEHPDATGVEASLNHFHIDAEDETLNDLAIALTAAATLADALRRIGETGAARVIVSRTIAGENPSSTVRFHRLRDRETWLDSDLERYRHSAVGYLQVPLHAESVTPEAR